ncbi:MAG: hypothetical protein NC191_02730 [Muribaculaceae bacterium]|nr:hypothetical protein [Muribaculaceae bacterium]
MKKILLALIVIILQVPQAHAFEFVLNVSDNQKTCYAYEDGYKCEGEEPVHIKNFKDYFKLSNLHISYPASGIEKKRIRLWGGCKIKEDLIYTSMNFIKKKGVLVSDENGGANICKAVKNGYVCSQENIKKNYEFILPATPWKFSIGKEGMGFLPLKITQKDCLGYEHGYQCPGAEPVYIENFWTSFLPFISNVDYMKNPKGTDGLYCYHLKNGYFCPGELPVITNISGVVFHKGIIIADKNNPDNKNVCESFDNFQRYSDIGYRCNGEETVILKKRPSKVHYKGSKQVRTESFMRTDITGKGNYVLIECSNFANGRTYCPGEEDTPYYGSYPLMPGDKSTPYTPAVKPADKQNQNFSSNYTIYDHKNNKTYHVNKFGNTTKIYGSGGTSYTIRKY